MSQMELDIATTWTIEVQESHRHGKGCQHEGCKDGKHWRVWNRHYEKDDPVSLTFQDKAQAEEMLFILRKVWPTRKFRLRGST